MKLNPQNRHVTRRGLFSPSAGRVVSEVTKSRADMTLAERVTSDRRAVARSMNVARDARILEEQKATRRSYEIRRDAALQVSNSALARHRPLNRSRFSRRAFLVASAVTVGATKAFADTPFTSFAFPGTGSPTSRTMPARIADIFNVLDFGADPTAAVDSQPAIQAAITAASNDGIIFFPRGAYKVLSSILIPTGSGLFFIGEGNGSSISGNFNGFIFDNLSSPYNAAGAPSAIQQLNISNGYGGNAFNVTTNGNWSSSGSPVIITLTGPVSGVAVGGALWTQDANISTNTVFIGMITGVSGSTITVASAAIGSGGHSSLSLKVVQCYAASGTWLANATTITMASTPPAGISGQYYVFDYEYILADNKTDFNFGVATWSGTTLTFTPGTGAIAASIGSSDRLWLAPVAGGIRYSSVVGAIVSNCFISGFIGLTSSEDKIVANDPTLGGAEAYHIKIDTCTFSNPTGCQAVPGQTGIYIQNNSLAINNIISGLWCAIRLSGTACSVIGGRYEVNYFGIILGGDITASNNSASGVILATISLESNLLGIYIKSAGNTNINAVGIICNAINPIGGIYINSMSGVIQNVGSQGNFGTGYAIFIADPGNNRGSLKLTAVSAANFSTPSQSWRVPAQAWWGACEQCIDATTSPQTTFSPVYIFANLPGVGANPAAVEGDDFNISDGTNGLTWGQTATNTGTHTTHYKVRYNGTNWTVVGM